MQSRAEEYLARFPCVAITGPRQVGKTTLAREILYKRQERAIYLDLELLDDYRKLEDAQTYLLQFEDKLVVIDEVQRMPKLFPLLRALIDKKRTPGRFLLLGSASPDLIRESSESLAGRIIYLELTPLTVSETGETERLWLKGGFPEAYLEEHGEYYRVWMSGFIRTYLERDLPQLGFRGNASKAEKLWSMLAHWHGNMVNYSELAKSLDLSAPTVRSYLEFLEKAFLVRLLRPYTRNLKKRIEKSPKIYLRDSGILHYFLGIQEQVTLYGHPKLGSSWEGFVLEQIAAKLPVGYDIYFYRTREGAEIDIVLEHGGRPWMAVEVKFGTDFKPQKGNIMAAQTLGASRNFIVVKNDEDFTLSNGFRVCGVNTFLEKYLPKI